jgi:hypothetical protein
LWIFRVYMHIFSMAVKYVQPAGPFLPFACRTHGPAPPIRAGAAQKGKVYIHAHRHMPRHVLPLHSSSGIAARASRCDRGDSSSRECRGTGVPDPEGGAWREAPEGLRLPGPLVSPLEGVLLPPPLPAGAAAADALPRERVPTPWAWPAADTDVLSYLASASPMRLPVRLSCPPGLTVLLPPCCRTLPGPSRVRMEDTTLQ